MARNVFGNPITVETLKGLPEYKNKTVTEEDTAKVALSVKDTVDAGDIIRQCLGNVDETSRGTLVMLYNATGKTVRFHKHHDFHGWLLTPPPPEIENGQWGSFVHVASPPPKDESSGGVVYRRTVEPPIPEEVDWMFSWLHNPLQISAYTEIGPGGSFDEDRVWELIYRKLEASGTESHAEYKEWVSDAKIERKSPTVAIYKGVMSRRKIHA